MTQHSLKAMLQGLFLGLLIVMPGCSGESNAVTATIRKNFEIIAHRGSSFTAPENTLAAANLAWQQNADAVEIDVHLSSDKKLMVIHDETTGRTAGLDYVVKDTASGVLRGLDAGSFKGAKYAGEKIPFLEEVLATIPPGKRLLIESKVGGTEIVSYLQKAILDSGQVSRVAVHSFFLTPLLGLKKILPTVPAYLIKSSNADENQLILDLLTNGLNGATLDYHVTSSQYLANSARAGLETYVWVVDDLAVGQQFLNSEAFGILTNRPDVMLTLVGR